METDGKVATPPQKKYYIDCTNLHVPREGVELTHPLSDSMGEKGEGEGEERGEEGRGEGEGRGEEGRGEGGGERREIKA